MKTFIDKDGNEVPEIVSCRMCREIDTLSFEALQEMFCTCGRHCSGCGKYLSKEPQFLVGARICDACKDSREEWKRAGMGERFPAFAKYL